MGVPLDPDPVEAGARINAAAAYAGMDRAEMAAALSMSPSTYDRMTGKRSADKAASWAECARVAEVTGLPYAFFAADFARLGEITDPATPIPSETSSQAAIRLTKAALDRAARRRASRQKRAQRTRRAEDDTDASR